MAMNYQTEPISTISNNVQEKLERAGFTSIEHNKLKISIQNKTKQDEENLFHCDIGFSD
jgi:hypothetical protein